SRHPGFIRPRRGFRRDRNDKPVGLDLSWFCSRLRFGTNVWTGENDLLNLVKICSRDANLDRGANLAAGREKARQPRQRPFSPTSRTRKQEESGGCPKEVESGEITIRFQ